MSHRTSAALGTIAALVVLGIPSSASAQDVMTPELLWRLQRVSAPAVSADGQKLAYGIRTYDVSANKGDTDLFVLPVAGGEPTQLTAAAR